MSDHIASPPRLRSRLARPDPNPAYYAMNDRAAHAVDVRVTLQRLLYPESVAVLGASESAEKWGGRILKYLVDHGYQGRIVPIRPRAGVVQGLAAYASIKDVPDTIDVAILAVPAAGTVDAVRECAEAGVGACVIIASQFAESGREGELRQEAILSIARGCGMRVLGPNCLGLVNPHARLALSASLALGHMLRLPAGSIGLVSQSGALMGSLIAQAYDLGAGFSACVSVGNQSDLELCDFFEHFIDDQNTQVICLYVEGLLRPERFVVLAQRARARGKPVLLTKAGRSESGKRAVAAHTASTTGAHDVMRAVCETYGVLMVDDAFDLLWLAEVLVRMGPPGGDGVALFSGSGGAAALLADTLAENGLRLARLAPATRRRLEPLLPETSRELPIDLGLLHEGRDHDYGESISATLCAVMEDADAAIGLYLMTTQPHMEQAARAVARAQKTVGKPILFVNAAGGAGNRARAALAESRLLGFDQPSSAFRVLRMLVASRAAPIRTAPVAVVPIRLDDALDKLPRGTLTDFETKQLLRYAGIPAARERLVRSRTVAAAAAREIGFPVALKIEARGLLHKSDVGGVRLNLTTLDEVVSAYGELTQRGTALRGVQFEGCLVQEMIRADHELTLATRWDAQFGTVVIVGVGGTLAEMVSDKVVALAPIDATQAEKLLRGLRSAALLHGYRGTAPLDFAAVARVIADVSQLAANLGPRLAELEINPLFATDERVIVGDAHGQIRSDWEMPLTTPDWSAA